MEELLAARFPRPDVRDLVRRLPAQSGLTLGVGCSAEKARAVGPPREPPREPSAELSKPSLESRSREPLGSSVHLLRTNRVMRLLASTREQLEPAEAAEAIAATARPISVRLPVARLCARSRVETRFAYTAPRRVE